ncbi:hypothetical protein TrST_g2908 [Triparma strigata]|uniref:MAGE domain-containing protein n=1 Tax=Triparma strigata TaxID=1606541 RepID=A0A9W7BT45_9STRA|nr:hypothetical protein TrST_g2908 [Triparma strigata]
MSRPKRGRSQSSPPVSDDEGSVGHRKKTAVDDEEEEDNKEGILEVFTQTLPEASQSLLHSTSNEDAAFLTLSPPVRSKLINDMVRYFIFMAGQKKAFTKRMAVESVLEDYRKQKIAGAIFESATKKLHDLYGWSVLSTPSFMLSSLPPKYKDLNYIINHLPPDTTGDHASALNERYDSGVNGFLIVVLCLIYNKGFVRSDTKRRNDFKWVKEESLYGWLNEIDGEIGEEVKKAKEVEVEGVGCVPNVLEDFVASNYLITEKVKTDNDFSGVYYAWGPRAALEVGRKQIIYYTANVLDQQPDPTMLQELEEGEEEEEEGEEEREE